MDIKVLYTGVIIFLMTGIVLLLENPKDPAGLCRAQCQVYCEGKKGTDTAEFDVTGVPRSCVEECHASKGQEWNVTCKAGTCEGTCIHWQGDYIKKIPRIPRVRLHWVAENQVTIKWPKDWTINNTVIYVIQGQTSAQEWIPWEWVESESATIEVQRHLCGCYQFRVAAITQYGTFGFSEPRSIIPMPEVSLNPSKFIYNASTREFTTKAVCKPPDDLNVSDVNCDWTQITGHCPDLETAQPIAVPHTSTNVMLLKYYEVGYRCKVVIKVRLKLGCGARSEEKHLNFTVAACRPEDAFKCPPRDYPPGKVSDVEINVDKRHSLLRVKWNEPSDKGSHGIDRFIIEWGVCQNLPILPIKQLVRTNTTRVSQPEISISIKDPTLQYGVKILALGPGQAIRPITFALLDVYCVQDPGPDIGRPPNHGHNPGNVILENKGIKVVHYPHTPRLHVSWEHIQYRDKKPDAVKQFALRWGPLTNPQTDTEIDVENSTLIPGNNSDINITVNNPRPGTHYGIQLRYLHSRVEDEDDVMWNTTEVLRFIIPNLEDSNNSAPPIPDSTIITYDDNTTSALSRTVTSEMPVSTTLGATTGVTTPAHSTNELPHALRSKVNQRNKLIYIIVPCLVVLLLICGAVTIVMNKKRKRPRLESNLARARSDGWDRYNSIHLAHSPNSQGESDRIILVPDKWELPRSTIVPGPMLGTGAFGQVVKGCVSKSALLHVLDHSQTDPMCLNLKTSDHSPNMITVAIKMLQEDIEETYRQDFMKEIKLMKGIGPHRHIVSMLGCCTLGDPVCLVVEHVPNGDLLSYLRDIRLTCKHGNTLPQTDPENNYTNMAPINVTPADLLSFARQIAIGMEFLSQKGYVHRDLAARNILVGDHKTVKIGDFGLARYVYDDKVYVNRRGGKLPVKWMSIEAIFDLTFSSASDAWSYGIVLFEICTLGGTPYPVLDNTDLLRELRRGWRMDAPQGCSQELYAVMLSCWKEVPTSRPTFSDLRRSMESMLERTTCTSVNYITLPMSNDGSCDSLVASTSGVFRETLDEDHSLENSVSSSTNDNSEDGSMILPSTATDFAFSGGKDLHQDLAKSSHSLPICFTTKASKIFRREADDDVFDSASFTDFCECGKDSTSTAFEFEDSCSSCGKLRESFRDKMKDILPVCRIAFGNDSSPDSGSPLSDRFSSRLDGRRSDRIESDISSSTCSSGEFLIPSNTESHPKEQTHSADSEISVTSTSYLLTSEQEKSITKTLHLPLWEETKL